MNLSGCHEAQNFQTYDILFLTYRQTLNGGHHGQPRLRFMTVGKLITLLLLGKNHEQIQLAPSHLCKGNLTNSIIVYECIYLHLFSLGLTHFHWFKHTST